MSKRYNNQKETSITSRRYWYQRNSIWSRYDEGDGIYMTDDAWFGVTPEPVAKYITRLLL